VLFMISQGPLCAAGPVSITGLKGVRPVVVERELRFKKGDTLTSVRIKSSVSGLYGTGLFNFVQITPSVSDAKQTAGTRELPVTVTVDEAKFFTVDASAGYGTYEQFRAAVRTAYANCFGLGHVAALDGNADIFKQRAELSFAVPWIFSAPLRAEIAPYIEHDSIASYNGLFEGVRLSLVPRQPDRFSYRLWGRYEKTLYLHIDTTKDIVITGTDTVISHSDTLMKNTQSVGVDFTYTLLKSAVSRKQGIQLRMSPELAGLGGRSFNQYYRGLVDLRGYSKLFRKAELSAALCAGYAHGYGAGGAPVPPQAQYYIGREGMRPIRGYTNDTGGTAALVVNLFELSLPVYKWIGVTFFSDGGYAGTGFGSTTFKDMLWVAGPGLSVKTSFGELRADFAWRLNGKTGWGAPFFSLGSTF
jgi:outer membrane protein assembly factor BamA